MKTRLCELGRSAQNAEPRAYSRPMRRILLGLALWLSLAGVTVTAAAADGTCQIGSQTSQVQTRPVTGMIAASTHYGAIRRVVRHRHHRRHVIWVRTITRYTYEGTQSRTVTTTVTQCDPTQLTSSSATAWTGAIVVVTRTTQRVR